MMERISKRISLCANIATILLRLMGGNLLIRGYFYAPTTVNEIRAVTRRHVPAASRP